MTSENAAAPPPQHPGSASENTTTPPRRRPGGIPTALAAPLAAILDGYTAALARAPLSPESCRTYASKVRQYLAWLAAADTDGDPLTDPRARDWAVRDYRTHLLTTAKRAPATINNALAAVDDFYTRRGLGPANTQRADLPTTAPRALDQRATLRWLRAVEACTLPRDRALADIPFYAGARISETVALDVDDVRLSARKGTLRLLGKGTKPREVQLHPQLREDLGHWLAERPGWPGPRCQRVVHLHRRIDGWWLCRNCVARSRAQPCSRCGAVREPAARDPDGRPLCPNCLITDPANQEACVGCGRRRPVCTRTVDGPRCQACQPVPTMTCSICGRSAPAGSPGPRGSRGVSPASSTGPAAPVAGRSGRCVAAPAPSRCAPGAPGPTPGCGAPAPAAPTPSGSGRVRAPAA